jgi:hypothetical protein
LGPRRGSSSGALLVGSVVQGHLARGFHRSSWALGLLGFPAVLLAWPWLRARRTPTGWRRPARVGHARNLAVFLAPVPDLLVCAALEVTCDAVFVFYGGSMLLAALRGYAGCGVLAVSNWLPGREGQIGGAVFWPVDQLERRPLPEGPASP